MRRRERTEVRDRRREKTCHSESEKEQAKDLVTIAERSHLFPSRTQKLSSLALMVLGGQLPGRVGRRQFEKSNKRLVDR